MQLLTEGGGLRPVCHRHLTPQQVETTFTGSLLLRTDFTLENQNIFAVSSLSQNLASRKKVFLYQNENVDIVS